MFCAVKSCARVLSVMPYKTFKEGVAMMVENLEHEGKGHSICVHSNTPENVEYAAISAAVSRVIVNQPSAPLAAAAPPTASPPPPRWLRHLGQQQLRRQPEL